MKKLLLFALLLTMGMVVKAECQDGPYALYVNGNSVCAFEDAGMSPDQLPQLHAVASLKPGDKVEFCNTSCDARWFPQNVETGGDVDGSGNFTIESGVVATCNVEGCYNFWWKKQANNDRVYIGTDGDCGGGQGGGQGGGTGVEGNPRYYYKMYTKSDDTWHEPSEETIFDHGVAEMINYTGEAYVFVLFQVDGQGGVQYRTEEFMDATHRSVKLVREGPKDWQLPEGVTNLYLYDEGDDTYTLSADPIPGKKLADPQPTQGVENTTAPEKAHKVFIDGQLRIVRGDKIFDVTGRQL